MIYYIFKYIAYPFYFLWRRPKIYGRKNTKAIRHGKAIIICNHRTLRDPLLLVFAIPRFIHFMAKEELFETKIGAWFFRQLLVFPVKRHSTDTKSMKTALEILEKGEAFGIFPEGKRSLTDEIDKFEKGAAFFAIKAKAPILPAYIPKDNFKLFKRSRLYIGKAIMPEEYDFEGSKTAAVNKLTELFEQRINELKEQCENECKLQ